MEYWGYLECAKNLRDYEGYSVVFQVLKGDYSAKISENLERISYCLDIAHNIDNIINIKYYQIHN